MQHFLLNLNFKYHQEKMSCQYAEMFEKDSLQRYYVSSNRFMAAITKFNIINVLLICDRIGHLRSQMVNRSKHLRISLQIYFSKVE